MSKQRTTLPRASTTKIILAALLSFQVQAQVVYQPEKNPAEALLLRLQQAMPAKDDINRTRALGHFLLEVHRIAATLNEEDRKLLMTAPEVKQAIGELKSLTEKNITQLQEGLGER